MYKYPRFLVRAICGDFHAFHGLEGRKVAEAMASASGLEPIIQINTNGHIGLLEFNEKKQKYEETTSFDCK